VQELRFPPANLQDDRPGRRFRAIVRPIMSILVAGIALLALVGLLAADLLSMRSPEFFGSEDLPDPEPPYLWSGKSVPALPRAAAVSGLVFGTLSFPATLAPVLLCVLALRTHDVGTDGQVALAALIIAAMSMSAAMKTIRVGRGLLRLHPLSHVIGRRCLLWLGVWNAAQLALLLLFPFGGDVFTAIAGGYFALSVAFWGLLFRAHRSGDDAVGALVPKEV